MNVSLNDLTTELLIKIFKYLSFQDQLNLRLTCRRFNNIISSGMHLLLENDVLVTNQLKPTMQNRSKTLLSMLDKIRISHNWKAGRYKERTLYRERRKCMPWLSLEKDRIWISREKHIKCYKRGDGRGKTLYSLCVKGNVDICKFVYKQNCLLTGLADGSIWMWTPDKEVIHFKSCHASDVNAVDLDGHVVATGSRDNTLKLWSVDLDDREDKLWLMYKLHLQDRVWSTAFSPNGQYLFIGTAGCNAPSSSVVDVESKRQVGSLGYYLPSGSGALDVKWESPHIFWTCGYDTCLRRWDMRMNTCIQHWEDPYQSTVYCLDYDNYCTAMTGLQSHGRTVLWDTRQQPYVQMYFANSCTMGRSSPVYSLGFDATHLYTATDHCLNMMDFTDSEAQAKDYSNHFSVEIIVGGSH